MATRVDPEAYADTPLFRGLLRERKGRWPGIPTDELPPIPPLAPSTPLEEPQSAPPAMYRVQPLSGASSARVRPYTPLTDYDPENMPERDWDADPDATAPMPLPPIVGD